MSDWAVPRMPPLRNPIFVAAIVACAFFMETLDSTVIVTALPRMADAFGSSPVRLSLGLTAYIITLAIVIPASGWIADRLGTRNVFCAAIGIFTVASVLCGFSNLVTEFVLARILQGVGGAMMSPVGRLVVLRSTERTDLVRVMNFVTLPGLIGPIIGPPVGGFITTYLSWRYIFFLNVPVGLLGMALVFSLIRNFYGVTRRPFDIVGFALNGAALATLIYGMDLLGHRGVGRDGIVLVAVGLALGVVAVRYALRARHPLVDLSALRVGSFRAVNAGGSFFRMAISGPTFLLPLLFQVGLGMTAFASGLLLLVHAGGDFAAKLVTMRFIRGFGFRAVLIGTTFVFAATIGACAFFTAATPLWVILPLLFISGVCRSLQMTSQTSFQFAEISSESVTAASTLSSALLQIVRAIGVAAAAAVLSLSVALRGGGDLGLADFRVGFIAVAVVALGSLFWYLPLHPASGAELSGHRRGT
jgi:EmrB/QacA subfamily drug resistance transporter